MCDLFNSFEFQSWALGFALIMLWGGIALGMFWVSKSPSMAALAGVVRGDEACDLIQGKHMIMNSALESADRLLKEKTMIVIENASLLAKLDMYEDAEERHLIKIKQLQEQHWTILSNKLQEAANEISSPYIQKLNSANKMNISLLAGNAELLKERNRLRRLVVKLGGSTKKPKAKK